MAGEDETSREKFPSRRLRLLKFLSQIPIITGIAAVAVALIEILWSADWRHHFFGLLRQIWGIFKITEGSSTTGIISTLIGPIIFVVVTLWIIWRDHGFQALKEHWQKDAIIAIRVAVIVCLVLYGPVFVWSVINVGHTDHSTLVLQRNAFRHTNINYASQIAQLTKERDALRAENEISAPSCRPQIGCRSRGAWSPWPMKIRRWDEDQGLVLYNISATPEYKALSPTDKESRNRKFLAIRPPTFRNVSSGAC